MSDVNLIRRRKAELTEELNRLQILIGELQAEYRDLGVAERVLEKLAGKAGRDSQADNVADADQHVERSFAHAEIARPLTRSATTKPAGAPSVPNMIFAVLKDARKEGLRGLEPKEMTTRIAKLWWPDVRPEATNSIAWRMWKRDQLVKDGAVYMLPKKEEAADDLILRSASAASANPAEATAQGREVGPGGGT